MPEIEQYDPFDPKKICDDLIKRAKQARAWFLFCYVDEAWMPPNGMIMPFDLEIKNGIFCCRVIAPSKIAAQKLVCDTLPVIQFINLLDKE